MIRNYHPRRMRPRKIMFIVLEQIMETHPKDQHPICVKFKNETLKDRSTEDQRIAPRLRETRQRRDKLLTTLLTVKLRAQE